MDQLHKLHITPPFDKFHASYYPVLHEFPHLPVYFVVGYLIMIVVGPKLMEKRTAWKMNGFVKAWNLFLSIGSFFIFLNIIPYLVEIFYTKGLVGGVCMAPDEKIWTGFQLFCAWIFTLTKFIELIDTVILILKKRDIIFLHWYHHTTVLLYTWYCTYTNVSIGWSFLAVNAFVHTFMYYYYYLSACGKRPSWGKMITQIQLIQMVIGVFISSAWAYYYKQGICPEPRFDGAPIGTYFLAASVVMYGSYLLLFAKFYFGRWSSKSKPDNGRLKKE